MAAEKKFKVGDSVRVKQTSTDVTAGKIYEVVEVDPQDDDAPVRIIDDAGDPWWLNVSEFELVITPVTAIVALIENDQPMPATRPVVHTSAEAADAEARRLASVHKGQEFGVFVLGATHKEARVYEHEWQRLAVGGEKINAIRELRAASGLGLATAKAAIEDWLHRESAEKTPAWGCIK